MGLKASMSEVRAWAANYIRIIRAAAAVKINNQSAGCRGLWAGRQKARASSCQQQTLLISLRAYVLCIYSMQHLLLPVFWILKKSKEQVVKKYLYIHFMLFLNILTVHNITFFKYHLYNLKY